MISRISRIARHPDYEDQRRTTAQARLTWLKVRQGVSRDFWKSVSRVYKGFYLICIFYDENNLDKGCFRVFFKGNLDRLLNRPLERGIFR